MAEGFGRSGGADPGDAPGDRGIRPRTILAPVLAWMAVAFILALYLNQRGHWRSAAGTAAYRDCFGSLPAGDSTLLRAASWRHTRYTGEMLSMECYAEVEGDFDRPRAPDSSRSGWPGAGSGWSAAPGLGEKGGLRALLARHGLSRAPEWFARAQVPDSARVGEEDQGKWFYVHVIGSRRLLIAGSWKAKERREAGRE